MKEQADIQEIKETISSTLAANGIDALQVYLFGSRARGDFSGSSDYDIMIVVRDKLNTREKIKLFTVLRRNLAKKKFDVDIVIKSAKEVNFYKNKIGHIVRSALQEGVLI